MTPLDALFTQAEQGQVGCFFGRLILEWSGPSDWFYMSFLSHLRFVRSMGDIVDPEDTPTDGGSVPRPFWNLPGLDPTYYMKAYVIHDYMFRTHQKAKGVPVNFDEANLILAEMLVVLNCPRERVRLIYEAVELGGRSHWEGANQP